MGRKQECFTLFRNGHAGECFYPNVANASPHIKHDVAGPGKPSSRASSWAIGHDARDQAEDGKRYEVRLFVNEEEKPERVDWLPVRGVAGLEDARGRGFLV